MCRCSGEKVNHLLLHVAYVLGSEVLKCSEVQAIDNSSSIIWLAKLLLGNMPVDIWNLVLACLMWSLWKERNSLVFEDAERSLDQLQSLLIRTCLIGLGLGVSCIVLPFLSSKTLLHLLFEFFYLFLRSFVFIIVNMKFSSIQ